MVFPLRTYKFNLERVSKVDQSINLEDKSIYRFFIFIRDIDLHRLKGHQIHC